MARKMIQGRCLICGTVGDLSFEHVPPRKAFNDRPVVRVNFEQAMSLGPDEILNGPIEQRGMGAQTLCVRCNSITGHWYGGNFVDWCYQGMDILIRSNGNPSLFYLNYLFPLRILKQIVTMFFSLNADGFQDNNQELVRFVLNRDMKYLPPKYRFFVYYNIEGRIRSSGIVAALNLRSNGSKDPSVFSELTYPPFGYVMTLDSEPTDARLVEITYFSRYDYNAFCVSELKLPVLPTHTVIPGDYRNKEQIYREAAA
jgi:hypothetical protein